MQKEAKNSHSKVSFFLGTNLSNHTAMIHAPLTKTLKAAQLLKKKNQNLKQFRTYIDIN